MNSMAKKALFTSIALALAGATQAAPVASWTVGVDTVFVQSSIITSVPGTNPVTFVDDRELRWGTPATTGGPDSGLLITNSPISTTVETNGSLVPNVSITHRNNPIVSGSGSLRYVDILSTLTLTPVVPGTPVPLVFGVSFFETPNNPGTNVPCADGTTNNEGLNTNGCADIFVISQNSINFPFFFTDLDYDLSLSPEENLAAGAIQNRPYFISFLETSTGLNPLPNAACDAVAGAGAAPPNPPLDVPTPCLGFRTPENATTTVQFGALITTVPVSVVPEPGSLALMGLGLGALALIRRRKLAVV